MKKPILVVEDHESIRYILTQILGKEFSAISAKDGLEAMAMLQSGQIDPEAIILDLSLPRISGIEFLVQLRASGLFHEIPVLVVSGDESLRVRCENIGIQGFVAKPFRPDELMESLHLLLALQTID